MSLFFFFFSWVEREGPFSIQEKNPPQNSCTEKPEVRRVCSRDHVLCQRDAVREAQDVAAAAAAPAAVAAALGAVSEGESVAGGCGGDIFVSGASYFFCVNGRTIRG